jgi:alpha-tubulin suppressor-like RCC1 family protein
MQASTRTFTIITVVIGAACTTDRSTTSPVEPVLEPAVRSLSPAIPTVLATVVTGANHTCGLTPVESGPLEGRAYCWGRNDLGQLGNGGLTNSNVPVPVQGTFRFKSISSIAGAHTCAITVPGKAYCWGRNTSGELGNGGVTNSAVPVPVAGNLTFKVIAGGLVHTCGLSKTGKAYCWGDNAFGELGNGSFTSSLTPVPVSGGRTFVSITVSFDHSCALEAGGQAYCWGSNTHGQLGTGDTLVRNVPAPVTGGLNFTRITSGSIGTDAAHTCASTSSNVAYCWGINNYGQLGIGSTLEQHAPTAVIGIGALTSLSAGAGHTCGLLTSSGEGYCWGFNFYGQLGNGNTTGFTPNPTPTAVIGGLTFQRISGGNDFTCALSPAGQVYCWGYNAEGQLGDGTNSHSAVPVAVVPF